MHVHVIGIGTRRGADSAGLAVVESLDRGALPPGTRVATCERPLPDLLDLLADADAVVLVDAARGGGPRGGVRRAKRGDLLRAEATSSHGFGVAHVLDLAAALDRAPTRVEIVAVEGADRAAIAAGARAVVALARALARSGD
jgi:hydrogenase maturation protease